MKVRPSLLARLAVYATALCVVATAEVAGPSIPSAVSALRTLPSEPVLDPVRLILTSILLVGILLEIMQWRATWR